MHRAAVLCLSTLLLSAGTLLLSMNACGGGSSPIPSGRFQHVIIIFQENRTPDNLFHDPALIAKGADIASSGLTSASQTIPLSPTSLGVDYDLDHSHKAFVAMYDSGKMDGADKIYCDGMNCPANPQFMYVQASDVGPYFQLAEQYAFGDRMFQTNEGPSFPAHQFIISGTSAPSTGSNLLAAENTKGAAGCAAPSTSTVALIDPSGNESSSMYPCFEHASLTDELNSKGISWRYYAPNTASRSIWTAPNAIQHMCGPNATPPNATACVGTDWVNHVVLRPAQILNDIGNNQLDGVSWVIPAGQNSDHPSGGFHCECHWQQFVLAQHRHHHHVGRLGWLVRSRSSTSGHQ